MSSRMNSCSNSVFCWSYVPFWGASCVAQLVKNLPAMQGTLLDSWVGKFPWRRDRLPTPVFLGFPGGSVVKNLPVMRETCVWSPGRGNPLKESIAIYSSILAWRILMDRGAWWATVHVVTKSQTWQRLSTASDVNLFIASIQCLAH